MDPLVRIKRLVLAQRVVFTAKAESEMYYVLISSKRSTAG
jgi:hypothetical protein